MMKTTQVGVRFEASELERIDQAAKRARRSRSDMIRILVEDGLNGHLDMSSGQAVELHEVMEAVGK